MSARLSSFDALRGLAVLGVVSVHCSKTVEPESPLLRTVMASGERGVQLFYVVSAFTLAMSWHTRAGEPNRIARFFLRRFFRIAPMFYLAIVLYLGLYGMGPRYWAPDGLKWWFVPMTATFLHGFHLETINSVVPGGWSIAVEVTFYALLPVLLVRLRSVWSALLSLAGSLVLLHLYSLVIYAELPEVFAPRFGSLIVDFPTRSFPGQASVFAIGLLAYFVAAHEEWKRLIASLCAILLATTLLVVQPLTLSAFLSDHILVAGYLGVAVVLLTKIRCALVNPITVALGKISFSLYLLHIAVVHGLGGLGLNGDAGALLHFAVVLALASAASCIAWRYVEQPGIELGRRLIERHSSQLVGNG